MTPVGAVDETGSESGPGVESLWAISSDKAKRGKRPLPTVLLGA